jgi:hypothetical protein
MSTVSKLGRRLGLSCSVRGCHYWWGVAFGFLGGVAACALLGAWGQGQVDHDDD